MSFNWNGIMELFSDKYRPSWESVCGGSDVKGIMELADSKYKPTPEAHGICTDSDIAALPRYMVRGDGSRDGKNDTDLYYPRVVLDYEEMCCAGGDCTNCDNILWDIGKTPKKVKVVVSDVDWQSSGCSEYDPNGEYILTQVADMPCAWAAHYDPFWVYFESYSSQNCSLSETNTSSCVNIISPNHYYFINCAAPCGADGLTYYNQPYLSNCCSGTFNGGCSLYNYPRLVATFGGQAEVSWPIEE